VLDAAWHDEELTLAKLDVTVAKAGSSRGLS
jgi:hypothetical protein